MNYPDINLFDLKVLNLTKADTLAEIDQIITQQAKAKFFFVNADCFNKLYSDDDYKRVLQSTPYILGDGSGVRYASKIVKNPIVDNVNGTDLLPLLCEYSQQKNRRIYLLGARPGVAEKMAANLLEKYPNLQIAGVHHGYFQREEQSAEIIAEINVSQPDILLVAFGAPFQETWIDRHFAEIECPIQMGVGGLFDFYSGSIPRAPIWMRKLGIEWVYRLLQEPGRMWRRYIIGNPLFIIRLLKWKKQNA